MRASIITCVFRKELLEILRNRRTLMVMFGVPLILYPMLILVVGWLSQSKQEELRTRQSIVAIVNEDEAPKLLQMIDAPNTGLRSIFSAPDDARKMLQSGDVEAVIELPRRYQNDALDAKDVTLTELIDRSRMSAPFVEKKLDTVLTNYQQWIVEERLKAHNIPPSLVAAPKREITDLATKAQTFGMVMARVLPMFLMLTGMLGALHPALNATTTERELGTMETLLVTPATRGELLFAKAAIVLLSSLLTAGLNMASMSLVLWRTLPRLQEVTSGAAFDPRSLVLCFVASAPSLIFFSALVLMVGLIARNMREANAYATPVMLIPIGSMLIGIADPKTTTALLLTPVANTTVIIRDVLTGNVDYLQIGLAFLSSCVYAGLVLSMAARLFSNEQLVNPAWEPLSLRGLSHRKRSPRFPDLDEAITLFAVSLLLVFYVSPSLLRFGLPTLLASTEFLLILAPTMLFAWIGRYRLREVFSLRWPRPGVIVAVIFIALGMVPIVQLVSWLQEYYHILPAAKSDLEGMTKLFAPSLMAHPILMPIMVGLLAGICEELLFRGPLQTALLRRLPVPMAITIGGFLFAAAHMDLNGLPLRWVLGILLGWVVWSSGSILPAMVLHAVYDSSQVGWGAYQLLHDPGAANTVTNPLASGPQTIAILVGAAMATAGCLWIRQQRATQQMDIPFPETTIHGVDNPLYTQK